MLKKYQKLENIIIVVIIINIFLYLYFKAAQVGILPTYHLDGAFQTNSALLRIESQSIIGKNYLPYLGIGVVSILFPFYKMMGSNLYSSTFSANFITLLCGMLVCIIISYFLETKKKNKISILYGIIIFLIFSSKLSSEFYFYQTPGNSLRPVRSFLPYIIFTLYYFVKDKKRIVEFLTIALLGIISILWSNDYAYMTLLVFSVKFILDYRKRIKDVVPIAVIFFVMFCILVFITKINFWEYFKYNFGDVSKDQWWYFMPLIEQSRFLKISDFITIIREGNLILPFIVILYYFIFGLKLKEEKYKINVCIGITLFLGGFVACVGGHIESEYFTPLLIWSKLSIAYLLLYAINVNSIFAKHSKKVIIIIIFLFSFFIMNFERRNLLILNQKLKDDNTNIFIPELGGYLKNDWKDYIDYIKKNKDKKIVEEYAGIWTSYVKPKNYIWRVDSAIHALGRIREESTKKIKEADIAITTRQDYNIWQKWSFSQNFWFYNELFKNFKIDYIAPTVVVWKRQKMKNPEEELKNCIIDPSGFLINENKEGYYEVELNYKVKRKSRGLIVLNNNIWDNDTFSISPYSSNVKFPIYLRTPNEKYNFNLIGGIKNVKIETCNYRKLEKHEYTNM